MNSKKGFSLFGKKNKELPNQSNKLQNINTEQNNMVQSSLPTEAPVENQISTNEQNSFANIPPTQETVNTNFETNIYNTPSDIQNVSNPDNIQTPTNNDFSRNVSEFSNQETEKSIENQLASESLIQLPEQPKLMAAPTSITETPSEPQATSAQPQPEPGTINALNNLGTYSMDLKENAKKEINKKPFIIIVGVLALLLCLTALVTNRSSKSFGKAPNEIIVPGENEEEPSHEVEIPEEDISKENNVNTNESEQEIQSNLNNPTNNEIEQPKNEPITMETLKDISIIDSVKRYEYAKFVEGAVFDTSVTNPSTVVLASNKNTIHEIKQEGQIFTISRDGNVVFYLDMAINQENFTEGYYPYARGNDLNNYLLIKIKKSNGFSDFYILDENFQIIEQGNYEEQYTPVATKEGIYFGIINCNGKRSSKKNGPTIDVYIFDTINGSKTYRYSIDYNNEMNKCS